MTNIFIFFYTLDVMLDSCSLYTEYFRTKKYFETLLKFTNHVPNNVFIYARSHQCYLDFKQDLKLCFCLFFDIKTRQKQF